MDRITLQLTGVAPLLMNAPRAVNPLDDLTREKKKITDKRKKTEDDHATIARLEWELGLYYADDLGPYVPGVNVEICLRDAAKVTRQGVAVTRGVYITDDLPLQYPGRNGRTVTRQALWDSNFKDLRRVGNQQNSVMRCRPMFPAGWQLTVPVIFEQEIIDRADLLDIADRAGLIVGLGDYRPRFGRFTVNATDS